MAKNCKQCGRRIDPGEGFGSGDFCCEECAMKWLKKPGRISGCFLNLLILIIILIGAAVYNSDKLKPIIDNFLNK